MNRDKKLWEKERNLQEWELLECTFKPEINESSAKKADRALERIAQKLDPCHTAEFEKIVHVAKSLQDPSKHASSEEDVSSCIWEEMDEDQESNWAPPKHYWKKSPVRKLNFDLGTKWSEEESFYHNSDLVNSNSNR